MEAPQQRTPTEWWGGSGIFRNVSSHAILTCEQSRARRNLGLQVALGTDTQALAARQPVALSPRPPALGGPPPRKAVLSMHGLSYGVIRVDTEEKLSVLTVQDVGQVMPGGKGPAGVCVCD